jgi:hypothetical protein
LVLNPPRDHMIAWSSPALFPIDAVLMRAHDGVVDHRVFVVCVGREMDEDILPDGGPGPTTGAPMNVFPVAEVLRPVTPRIVRPPKLTAYEPKNAAPEAASLGLAMICAATLQFGLTKRPEPPSLFDDRPQLRFAVGDSLEGLITPSLFVDLPDPLVVAERTESFWCELAPSGADGVKDGAITFMHPVRRMPLAQIKPDPFNGVQFRRAGWQSEQ